MGESGYPDIERKGSMDRRRGSKTIYPMQGSPAPMAPYFEAHPDRKRRAWIIPLIVIVNVALFIVTMFVNDCPKSGDGECTLRFLGRFSFQPLRENPLFGPSSSTLVKMGGLQWNKVVNQHERWRLITCIWLHGGVVHLLANMLSLIFIGIRLEQEFGFVRIGIIYLLSAFGGSVVSVLFIENSVSVGASGALFGLLGAMLSELITNWTIYANKFAALVTLIIIIAINLAFGLLPHIDNFAHLGGFVSGFLLGFVFLVRPQFGWVNLKNIPPGYDVNSVVRSKHRTYQYVLGLLAVILLIVGRVIHINKRNGFWGTQLNGYIKHLIHYTTSVGKSACLHYHGTDMVQTSNLLDSLRQQVMMHDVYGEKFYEIISFLFKYFEVYGWIGYAFPWRECK